MKKSKTVASLALSMIVFACGGDSGSGSTGGGPVVILPPPAPPPAPPPPPPPPPAPTLTVTADPTNTSVKRDMLVLTPNIGGRVQVGTLPNTLPAGAKSYTHQWPGVYFEASFSGDSFIAKFNDVANEYRLFIDARDPIPLAQPGRTEYRIAGLTSGAHRIRLEKVTESIGEIGAFEGFYTPSNAQASPTPARARQIEFIGDSNMTGYGLRSPTRQCTQEQVRLLSDTQVSYPALTAKNFNAEYQVNAISGRGMARNFDGIVPDLTIPLVYPFTMLDKTGAYSDPAWQPQIIFIALGDNDFFTAVRQGEQWATPAALIADYFDTYERFLRTLYARNPNASVIVVWPGTPGLTNAADVALFAAGRSQLETKAQAIGFRFTEFTAIPDLGFEATACDFHATASDQVKQSNWLNTLLDSRPQFWAGN